MARTAELFNADRFTFAFAVAAQLALNDSGLDLDAIDLTRVGTVVSTEVGGIGTFEKVRVGERRTLLGEPKIHSNSHRQQRGRLHLHEIRALWGQAH